MLFQKPGSATRDKKNPLIIFWGFCGKDSWPNTTTQPTTTTTTRRVGLNVLWLVGCLCLLDPKNLVKHFVASRSWKKQGFTWVPPRQAASEMSNSTSTLKIPRIVVDDSTGSKFMNLVAYEMCPDFQNDFGVTSYLCFLDSLIDTAQDVKELRHAGMLLNYMGSDEDVAHLFNTMTTDLVPDLQTYHRVTNKIRRYCENPWTTSIAKLYYTHFSTPWSIVGFLGALLGLLFTAIQAFYSMRKNGLL